MEIRMKSLLNKITCLILMFTVVQCAANAFENVFEPYTPKSNEQVYKKNVYNYNVLIYEFIRL